MEANRKLATAKACKSIERADREVAAAEEAKRNQKVEGDREGMHRDADHGCENRCENNTAESDNSLATKVTLNPIKTRNKLFSAVKPKDLLEKFSQSSLEPQNESQLDELGRASSNLEKKVHWSDFPQEREKDMPGAPGEKHDESTRLTIVSAKKYGGKAKAAKGGMAAASIHSTSDCKDATSQSANSSLAGKKLRSNKVGSQFGTEAIFSSLETAHPLEEPEKIPKCTSTSDKRDGKRHQGMTNTVEQKPKLRKVVQPLYSFDLIEKCPMSLVKDHRKEKQQSLEKQDKTASDFTGRGGSKLRAESLRRNPTSADLQRTTAHNQSEAYHSEDRGNYEGMTSSDRKDGIKRKSGAKRKSTSFDDLNPNKKSRNVKPKGTEEKDDSQDFGPRLSSGPSQNRSSVLDGSIVSKDGKAKRSSATTNKSDVLAETHEPASKRSFSKKMTSRYSRDSSLAAADVTLSKSERIASIKHKEKPKGSSLSVVGENLAPSKRVGDHSDSGKIGRSNLKTKSHISRDGYAKHKSKRSSSTHGLGGQKPAANTAKRHRDDGKSQKQVSGISSSEQGPPKPRRRRGNNPADSMASGYFANEKGFDVLGF